MIWSSDKPTVPGWYWWRRQYQKKPYSSIIRVRAFSSKPNGLYIYAARDVKRCKGHWSGPIPSPEEG